MVARAALNMSKISKQLAKPPIDQLHNDYKDKSDSVPSQKADLSRGSNNPPSNKARMRAVIENHQLESKSSDNQSPNFSIEKNQQAEIKSQGYRKQFTMMRGQ